MTSPAERAIDAFREAHGAAPQVVGRAPGRVNLIGEHTDYNDGFVMPMALPFHTVIAAAPHPEGADHVTVHSVGYGAADFRISDDPAGTTRWAQYIHGMLHMLTETEALGEAGAPRGMVATVTSNIPIGASLSSSAALEMATGVVAAGLVGTSVAPATLARLGQRVENEVIGINSGIMDQMASAASTAGHATLIDCRSLELTPAPLPAGVSVVVMDTGTRRELVDSEYDLRRSACERAAAAIGVSALRDATMDQVRSLPEAMGLERRRAAHVIAENERTLAAADAMAAGDAATLGRFMNDSHTSLRDDYEVSGPALDEIVAIAQRTPGCLGARMTGGGFAGCAVALVHDHQVTEFTAAVADEYGALGIAEPTLWICRPAAGAGLINT